MNLERRPALLRQVTGSAQLELLVVEAELFGLNRDAEDRELRTWWEVERHDDGPSPLSFTFSVRMTRSDGELPLELYAIYAITYPAGALGDLDDEQLSEVAQHVVADDGLAAATALFTSLTSRGVAPLTGREAPPRNHAGEHRARRSLNHLLETVPAP